MLYYQTVSPNLVTILKRLMSFSELSEFRLVGGTALALQAGHRKSVDIDFFCAKKFDNKHLQFFLQKNFENFVLDWQNSEGFVVRIDDIKVDFFNWSIPFIYPPIETDNIRLADKREIAAMKMEAITGRKEKKDFIDIAVLLKEYKFKELLSSFRIRYPYISHKFVIESLTAIDYADESTNPEMLINYEWKYVKKDVQKNIQLYFLDQLAEAEKTKQNRLNKAEEILKKKNRKP